MEKRKKFGRLKLHELQSIFVMRQEGSSMREIGGVIKRSEGTVCKALNNYRHPVKRTWRRMSVWKRAVYVLNRMRKNRERVSRSRGHIRDAVIRSYVLSKLAQEGWSPEEIAARIGRELPGKKICAKTIYTFIKVERAELKKYLPEKGKPRRQRVKHRRGRFKQGAPEKRRLNQRPAQANDRLEVGHWEGDTMITRRRGMKAVLSLRDRKTRLRIFRLLPDLKAKTVLGVLRAIFESLPPELRKSLTLDNGSEFALSELKCLEKIYPGFKIYYCDSYKSWQKGSVENSHRGFRWYYPKGTDFAQVSADNIRLVEEKLNRRPMKCHEYKTAMEVFEMELAA